MPQRQLVSYYGLLMLLLALPSFAGPIVVPTAEGQLGEVPSPDDRVGGPRVEPLRGLPDPALLLAGVNIFGGAVPPPPEFQFSTDSIHGYPDPVPVSSTPASFTSVAEIPPSSSWSTTAANDGDFVAFSFSLDGSNPDTMTVRIATFDETGNSLVDAPIIDLDTFTDPIFSQTGVGVDNQGRATVVYTELSMGISSVRGQRIDAVTGSLIDPDFIINNDGNHASVDVALLDPAGNRLIVTTTEFVGQGTTDIKANIVDLSGGTPVVDPEFTVNSTPALFFNFSPVVAADPATGIFIAAWENLSGQQGNPQNIRARRFDANGNPIGDDFRVNTTTTNAQGQPKVAMNPGGMAAVAWAGDSTIPGDGLDVFMQVYGPDGSPIDGEIRVNTTTTGTQDRPTVRFLPDSDAQGRPQLVVAWRDVDNPDGSMARGTGQSYKCFSVGDDPTAIFADGFESGDTSSWSSSNP